MRDFQQLEVWQKSHRLVLAIYAVTAGFPKPELFGLTSQIGRAAASIPTNIAEGCGRDTSNDFRRFLTIAAGSVSELHYQLILAKDLHYLELSHYEGLTDDTISIRKMLHRLIQKLQADS